VFNRRPSVSLPQAPQVVGIDTHPPPGVDSDQPQTLRSRVDPLDAPALAVVDVLALVVDPGDHLIAGSEAGFADLDLLSTQPARRLHPLPRQRIQLGDLGIALGDHQRVLPALEALPPIGDHRLAAGQRIV
jgi:hypothetical protein